MHLPTACLTCAYLAAEGERHRAAFEIAHHLAEARLGQLRAVEEEVRVLRQLNESLTQRALAAEGLLAARAGRN